MRSVSKLSNMAEKRDAYNAEKTVEKTGPEEEIKLGCKRKSEEDGSYERTSPAKMKYGASSTSSKSFSGGISIKVGQLKSAVQNRDKVDIILKPKKGSVAAAFNDESDEEEEIPKEAKMRMKNLGKDTITSSGPNSFNKSKKGFTNHRRLLEKELKLSNVLNCTTTSVLALPPKRLC